MRVRPGHALPLTVVHGYAQHLLEGAKLLLEPVEGRGVEILDGLEGDDQVALAVQRLVDDPHAAGPEPPPDFEAVGPGEFVRG